MIDTAAKAIHEFGPNLLSAINVICTAIVAIVTAIIGYLGGRVHGTVIAAKKNGGAK